MFANEYESLIEELGLTGKMNPYGSNINDYSPEYLH